MQQSRIVAFVKSTLMVVLPWCARVLIVYTGSVGLGAAQTSQKHKNGNKRLLDGTYLCVVRVRTTVDSSWPSFAETCMTYCGCPFTRLLQSSTVFPEGAELVQSGKTSGRWLQRLVVIVTDSNYSTNSFRIRTVFPSAKKEKKNSQNGSVVFGTWNTTHPIARMQGAVDFSSGCTE